MPDRCLSSPPVLVGDDPLAGAVPGRDHQLGQQLGRGAVVSTGPLGVESDEAGVPSVGDDCAYDVLALAQQDGDVICLVGDAPGVIGPARGQERVSDPVAVQSRLVQAEGGHVQPRGRHRHPGYERPAQVGRRGQRHGHQVGRVGPGGRGSGLPYLARAYPAGGPPVGRIQLHLEPGRGAPAGHHPALVPHPHLPRVPAAAGQRAAVIADVRRAGGLDPAAVPRQVLAAGEPVRVLCDQHLVGALCPAGSRAFQHPAQPHPVRGDAERVHQMRAAQPGRGQGAGGRGGGRRGHNFVAPSVRPATK